MIGLNGRGQGAATWCRAIGQDYPPVTSSKSLPAAGRGAENSVAELKEGQGPLYTDADAVFDRIDTNNDGVIDRAEFSAAMAENSTTADRLDSALPQGLPPGAVSSVSGLPAARGAVKEELALIDHERQLAEFVAVHNSLEAAAAQKEAVVQQRAVELERVNAKIQDAMKRLQKEQEQTTH